MAAVLTLIRIKNLALVEELQWEVEPGFVAVTGETGAGKSIIIGALQLVLGERADKGVIRTGAETCTVEAVFAGSDLKILKELLNAAGIDPMEDELIIKRSLSTAGANRQFVNGSPTTIAVLKELGDKLIDLHGPHDHQSLLSPERQLELLDSFAKAGNALAEHEKAFANWQTLVAEHDALNTAETAREQELDLLRHQVSEITSAKLGPEEEEEIEQRYRLASNSKRLLELASAVTRRLSEDDSSVLSQLAETQRILRDLEKIDPEISPSVAAHETAVLELTEIARTLSGYAEKLDLDPSQLAALEQRVSLFDTLKRKYGPTLPDVIAFGERAAERMNIIEGRDAELARLAAEIERVRSEQEGAARTLHQLRSKAAPPLSENVRRNLRDLGFRQSEFEVRLTSLDKPTSSGTDAVELLFSPNPGEPLKPLRAIASSGEISRLMLAIKSALAAHDSVPLLIFDEIDANVGGEIAHAVAGKMKTLGQEHQVICITHLPQVAAAASSQFVVTKEVSGGRTHSRLQEVKGKARREEIARMLGGKGHEALKLASVMLGEEPPKAR